MMQTILPYFVELIAYSCIFIATLLVPILIFNKFRLYFKKHWLIYLVIVLIFSLIALLLTIDEINIYFRLAYFLKLPRLKGIHSEFHEIFWFIPAFFVLTLGVYKLFSWRMKTKYKTENNCEQQQVFKLYWKGIFLIFIGSVFLVLPEIITWPDKIELVRKILTTSLFYCGGFLIVLDKKSGKKETGSGLNI